MEEQNEPHLLSPVIDPLENLAKAALANPLLLREHNLGIHFLHKKENISDVQGFQRSIIIISEQVSVSSVFPVSIS